MTKHCLTLGLLLAASVAAAQAPATGPAPLRPPATAVLQTAYDLLSKGSDVAALKAVADALPPLSADLPAAAPDAATTRLCDLAAVANLRAGRPAVAQKYARVAYASVVGGRTDRLNLASAEIQLPPAQMHAVSLLAQFCQSHPQDETAMNLFGVALDRAAATKANAAAVAPYEQQYEALVPQLEKTHKGQRRWGTTWVADKQYAELNRKRNAALDDLKDAQQKCEEAHQKMVSAEQDNDDEHGKKHKRKGQSDAKLAHDIVKTQEAYADAQAKVAAAQNAVPAIPWTAPLTGVLPSNATADD